MYYLALCFLCYMCSSTLLFSTLTLAEFEERTKLKASFNEEEKVFKASFPRSDVQITIDHYQAPPFIGLTTWAAFTELSKNEWMMMGDTVLLQDEVNPIMSSFLDHGIQVSALHNHFFYDEPKIYFMHVSGIGHLEALAECVRQVQTEISNIRKQNSPQSGTFGSKKVAEKSDIEAAKLEKMLGLKGQWQDGRYKVITSKKTSTCSGRCTIGKEMGVNSWAVFSGNEEQAIVNGDLALYESELQKALKMLRNKNIQVVAIHNHMTQEEPRILFVHYWGVGKLEDLASSIKEALTLK